MTHMTSSSFIENLKEKRQKTIALPRKMKVFFFFFPHFVAVVSFLNESLQPSPAAFGTKPLAKRIQKSRSWPEDGAVGEDPQRCLWHRLGPFGVGPTIAKWVWSGWTCLKHLLQKDVGKVFAGNSKQISY